MADVPTDQQHDDEGTASLDHEAVLDAAAACYLRFGVAKTTAADIAKAAGTSRATLYRRFGTHEEILLEVLVRESEQMLADAAAQTLPTDHPVDQVIEGMVHAVREVQRRPVHAAVFGDESAGWVAGRALRLQAMRRLGEQGVRPAIEPALASGSMSDQDLDDLVEWMLRVIISYAAVPGSEGLDDADVRRQLRLGFGPTLERLLGTAPG